MTWTPPVRPSWVEKLVALGRSIGDDGRSIVSLEADSLLEAASSVTGLDDFGDGWFKEPLERLCGSLEQEARLHLPGRLRARGELQSLLQNRLRLVELWHRRPQIHNEQVRAPMIVTGLGRSGTTLLHELLACDPSNRAPLLWELMDTHPAVPDALHDPRGDLTDEVIKLLDEMAPSFTAMHENGGHLPTECIFAFAHQFSSDMFTGLYNVPSYTIWRSTLDAAPIYDWHRRMLQTLQADVSPRRWVLKAPSHLSALSTVFETYPDAQVVITHRDPLRVVGSLADMMATLHWMHSDHVEHETLVQFLCMGLVLQMDAVATQREAGALPEEQIKDVLYVDLVSEPIEVVTDLYDRLGFDMGEEFLDRLESYVASRHAPDRAVHRYRFEDTGLDIAEHRATLARYQELFAVPSEL